mgnify:CR=1 FL=1
MLYEFDASIGNPTVNEQDMHEIAQDMKTWTKKIQSHISYMSDVITAVKGQAVALSETQLDDFTVDELFKRVDILMRHEIKQALINLNIKHNVNQINSYKQLPLNVYHIHQEFHLIYNIQPAFP